MCVCVCVYIYTYLFILFLAALGLSCGIFVAARRLSSCGARAPGRVGSVVGGTWALSLRRASSVIVVRA